MSPTAEQQKEDNMRNDSVSTGKDLDDAPLSEPDNIMPPPARKTDNDGLATDLANLKPADGNVASGVAKEKAVDKSGDEEQVSRPIKVDENIDPKLTAETAPKPEGASSASTKNSEEVTTSRSEKAQVSHPIKVNVIADPLLTVATAPKPKDESSAPTKKGKGSTTSKPDTTTNAVPTDEKNTPRLTAYIKLHKDMMTSKSAVTTTSSEQARLYHHASHVARTLLTSNAKRSDLPLVMHAHACMVLGCSDEDDCFERMEEALSLVKQAVREGLLGQREGAEMVKSCEIVMGMRGQVADGGGSGDDGSGSEASGEEGEDCGEEIFELP